METQYKYGLRVVDAETVDQYPSRFELKIDPPNPPLCPFGNPQKFVGFDRTTGEYVRFTKSVFKRFFNKLRGKGKDNERGKI